MCDTSALIAALGDGVADPAAVAAILCAQHEESILAVNTDFILISTYLVFFMQAGFAMLCAGSVRSKNAMNILLKNVLDACAGAIAFYLFGYGFAYGFDGDEGNPIIGSAWFALADYQDWAGFIFQWAFAAAAATIVSGSVAERCQFIGYLVYSIVLTGFVYPVVVHWVWCGDGWLTAFRADPLMEIGMVDFAGSGVVHMTGGLAGLCGAMLVGPRLGRFDSDGRVVPIPGHSSILVVIGTFILWFGWYGFNPGSAIVIHGGTQIPGRVAVTTTLSGAAAGLTSLLIAFMADGVWDLLAVCNGCLAGLVAITSGCPVLEPWAAILCGIVGAFVFYGSSKMLQKLQIDDPLEAAPMHGFTGMWGVIAVGLLARKEYVMEAYGTNGDHYGLFYGGGGNLLGCQIIGVLAITAWVMCTMLTLFTILRHAGLLRVPPEEEMMGLDESHHGGSAYPDLMPATQGKVVATSAPAHTNHPRPVAESRSQPAGVYPRIV